MYAYDFFGDVHGQGDRLETLLTTLGYRFRDGAWRHPSRIAVFVGDLVDRGPQQLKTLRIVRGMVDAGSGLCIMGNHEHNAIGWLMPHPTEPWRFARDRIEAHRKQHVEFLSEVESRPLEHAEWIAWMRTLPPILELGNVRVAHACWDERSVAAFADVLRPDGAFTDEGLAQTYVKGSKVHSGFEVVTRGVELALPEGASFVDPLGKSRKALRIAWWLPHRDFRDIALPFPGLDQSGLPSAPVPEAALPVLSEAHLHFYGHYWMSGTPAPLGPKLVCLDYSGTPGRPLTAYRYDGEPELQASKFVQV